MRKILVIGKYGQLASSFANLSVDGEILFLSKDELNILNFRKTEQVIYDLKPNIIINTSAFHHLPTCEDHPDKAFALNSIAVLNLAKISKTIHSQLVTFSTDYIFDGTKTEPYVENDFPHPLQVYGTSKLAGEYLALNYLPEATWIIRTNGLYGGTKGSREKNGNFVLSILKDPNETILARTDLIVSPTYALDLAESSYKLITNPNINPGVYHLVNEGSCSWFEFAKTIVKYAKIDKEVKQRTSQNQLDSIKRPIFSALKNVKAKSIGIILPTWEDAVSRYIKNELNYE